MITAIFDTIQVLNVASWVAFAVSVSGSMVRMFKRRTRYPFDPLWNLLWLASVIQIGYIMRWWLGYVPDPTIPDAVNSLLGLRLMSAMLGFGLLHRRIIIEGWRW